MAETMRAYTLAGFDVPPEFADVPRPTLGPGEILVRVEASSVNPVDHLVAAGFFRSVQDYRFPAVFGRDVAGTVAQVGPRVTRYEPGDRVAGFVKRDHIGDGTFAEYVAVPGDFFVAAVPDEVATAAAGALGLSAVTAWECVEAVAAGAGDTVLVTGAPGGVGSFAVQLAAARGSTVIATARTQHQADHLRALGATTVVDWTAGDLATQLRELVPNGIDGLVDLVKHAPSMRIGEDEDEAHQAFADFCKATMRAGSRAASVTNGGVPELLGDVTCLNVHSTPAPSTIELLLAEVAAGRLVVPIGATFGFEDLPAAFQLLAAGGTPGKIAIDYGASS